MSNREFTATRTMLANAFATAGAELLAYMGSSSALAAIPETDPPKYVAAGPLDEIAKLLPAFDKPAAATVLTDERIAELNREAQDQSVRGLPPSIYLARAIEREVLAHAGKATLPSNEDVAEVCFDVHPDDYKDDTGWLDALRYDGEVVRRYLSRAGNAVSEVGVLAHAGVTAEPADKVQNERSIQGKTISEWYVAWCETSGNLKEAKACIGRYQKLVDELQTSGQPRPSVPDHIIHMIRDYGDARADDDRYAASKFGDAITAIRRLLAAQVPAAEVRAQALEDAAKVVLDGRYWNGAPASVYETAVDRAAAIRALKGQSTADKASEVRAAEKGGAA